MGNCYAKSRRLRSYEISDLFGDFQKNVRHEPGYLTYYMNRYGASPIVNGKHVLSERTERRVQKGVQHRTQLSTKKGKQKEDQEDVPAVRIRNGRLQPSQQYGKSSQIGRICESEEIDPSKI